MDVKRLGQAAPVSAAWMPQGVPDIRLDQLDAVCRKSRSARALRAQLDDRARAGGTFSRGDVDEMIRHAHKHGRINGSHAVVLAYYGRHHEHLFDHDARHALGRFLGKVQWTELMLEIEQLLDKMQQEQIEAEKKREIEKERLEDEVIKPEERHRELIKENGTAAERQAELLKTEQTKAAQKDRIKVASETDLDDEITNGGRVQLTEAQLVQLRLAKSGFANS